MSRINSYPWQVLGFGWVLALWRGILEGMRGVWRYICGLYGVKHFCRAWGFFESRVWDKRLFRALVFLIFGYYYIDIVVYASLYSMALFEIEQRLLFPVRVMMGLYIFGSFLLFLLLPGKFWVGFLKSWYLYFIYMSVIFFYFAICAWIWGLGIRVLDGGFWVLDTKVWLRLADIWEQSLDKRRGIDFGWLVFGYGGGSILLCIAGVFLMKLTRVKGAAVALLYYVLGFLPFVVLGGIFLYLLIITGLYGFTPVEGVLGYIEGWIMATIDIGEVGAGRLSAGVMAIVLSVMIRGVCKFYLPALGGYLIGAYTRSHVMEYGGHYTDGGGEMRYTRGRRDGGKGGGCWFWEGEREG